MPVRSSVMLLLFKDVNFTHHFAPIFSA